MGTEQVMGPDRPLAEGRWNGQHDLVLIAIVLLALGPRLVLSIVNTGANDPHMEVVSLILETNRLPHFDDCFQCYQPKLFHQITAAAVAAVGLEDPGRQRRLAQLLNFVAALGTVIVLWQMALQLPGGPGVRLLSFALVALNPRFNAITAQATNDSFVIFFGAVTIYSLWRFLEGASRWYCTSAVVSLILMSLAKTQGMVFFALLRLITFWTPSVAVATPGILWALSEPPTVHESSQGNF